MNIYSQAQPHNCQCGAYAEQTEVVSEIDTDLA